MTPSIPHHEKEVCLEWHNRAPPPPSTTRSSNTKQILERKMTYSNSTSPSSSWGMTSSSIYPPHSLTYSPTARFWYLDGKWKMRPRHDYERFLTSFSSPFFLFSSLNEQSKKHNIRCWFFFLFSPNQNKRKPFGSLCDKFLFILFKNFGFLSLSSLGW